MGFNPFNKSIDELESSDLGVLREVNEGWYIEYKSQGLSIKDYAKHLSAFANQHGGWFFIGIKEDEEKVTAGEFCGIPTNMVSSEIIKLREAVSAHCSPVIHFKYKCVNGIDNSIGLEADRSILIINVPKGFETPYIHSSGKIYRRVADQSTPEKDRYELNGLYERAQKYGDTFEKNLKSLPFLFNTVQPRAFIYLHYD
ncbi:ATP-binding protein, partial [Caldithrix abyssi]|nr:ATP-binding protein [Caldithrix abyssi]